MVRMVSDHSGSVITCVRSCCPLAQSTGTPSFKVSGYSGDGQLKSNSIYLNYIRYIENDTVTSNLLSTLSICIFIHNIYIYIITFFVAQQHLVSTKTLFYVGKVPGKFMEILYCCKQYVKLQT